MKTNKEVICRPCKEQNNWEIVTPGGNVLPNHFNTKQEAMRVAKKYAIEAGAELTVTEKKKTTATKQSKK